MYRFRSSLPGNGHSWLEQLLVHMVFRKRAGSDPLAVPQGMSSVDDVAGLTERVVEHWFTKRSQRRRDRMGSIRIEMFFIDSA